MADRPTPTEMTAMAMDAQSHAALFGAALARRDGSLSDAVSAVIATSVAVPELALLHPQSAVHFPSSFATVAAAYASTSAPTPAAAAAAASTSTSTVATPGLASTAAPSAAADPPAPPPRRARGRPRMHGAGRKENKALRTPVTYAHKLAVISFYEAHDKDINATVREFYAQLSPGAVASRKRQIYKWVKERESIEQMCFKQSTAAQSRRRERGTATTLGAAAELELVAWIRDRQLAGHPLSMQMIKTQAMHIAARCGVPEGAFQATWSWQQGFLKRHQLSLAGAGAPRSAASSAESAGSPSEPTISSQV
ncbi:hypothetical protein ATCC90586_007135 [Pythium insidiosum]|nr:hypothetical protein ATCC90586_007135 [Pythium insidiosum]